MRKYACMLDTRTSQTLMRRTMCWYKECRHYPSWWNRDDLASEAGWTTATLQAKDSCKVCQSSLDLDHVSWPAASHQHAGSQAVAVRVACQGGGRLRRGVWMRLMSSVQSSDWLLTRQALTRQFGERPHLSFLNQDSDRRSESNDTPGLGYR